MARPFTKGEQAKRKKELIESLYACDGILYTACQKIGLEYSTAKRWMTEDAALAAELEHSREATAAKIQAHVLKMATGEAPGGGTGAAAFWLKAQAGWTDRQTVEHKGSIAWDGAPEQEKPATSRQRNVALRVVSGMGAQPAGSPDKERGEPPDTGAPDGTRGDSPPGNFGDSKGS